MNIDTLSRLAAADEELNRPREDAISALEGISRLADRVGLSDSDILDALGKSHGTLTPRGIYYRTQATIVKFTTTIGATVLSILGVVTLVWLIKKGLNATLTLLKKGVIAFFTLVAGKAGEAFLSFFGIKGTSDEVRDGELSPDMLLLTLSAGMPGPVPVLITAFGEAFGNVTPPEPGSLSLGPLSLGSNSTSPSNAPVATTVSTASPAPHPAATTVAAGGSDLAAGMNLVSGILTSTGAGAAIGSWVGSLFSDEEVRDATPTQVVASSIAASQIYPNDPLRAVDLARRIVANLGSTYDHSSSLANARASATSRW